MTDTIVTGTAVRYDGSTTVNIEFLADDVDVPKGEILHLLLEDGAATSTLCWARVDDGPHPIFVSRRWTPAPGTHRLSVVSRPSYRFVRPRLRITKV